MFPCITSNLSWICPKKTFIILSMKLLTCTESPHTKRKKIMCLDDDTEQHQKRSHFFFCHAQPRKYDEHLSTCFSVMSPVVTPTARQTNGHTSKNKNIRRWRRWSNSWTYLQVIIKKTRTCFSEMQLVEISSAYTNLTIFYLLMILCHISKDSFLHSAN